MYNNPVLFFESVTLTENLTPNAHYVKAAIICDEKYKEEANALEKSFYDTPVEALYYTDPAQVHEFIISQKMGTCFYLIGEWDDAVQIFTAGVAEGISEDEIQVKIIGEKRKYVYCMKCFTPSEIDPKAKTVQCSCSAHLEVGPFYSKVRKGYIGYPFVPES